MKIAQLKLWRFRCFGGNDPAADGKPKAQPIKVTLEGDITALIGRNGSGKSAFLLAMQRLFGETREERLIRQEDFFVTPGETLETAPKRQLFIEALLVFPELETKSKEAEKTIPSTIRHMIVEGPDKTPIARIRLEATWQLSGTLDGIIEENAYWLLTPEDVPFGEPEDPTLKRKMTAADRAAIIVRYIPASRDVTALTRLTLRNLGRNLMQSVIWQDQAKIEGLIHEASDALDDEDAVRRVSEAIDDCWKALNAADTETFASLSVLPFDFQQIVRAASVVLEPSATGRTLGVEDLSDGQRSLFHFALVKALLDLKLALEKEVGEGKKPPFSAEFMRAPALTVFAFEQPENHLAPYFLARLIGELKKLTAGQRVQGVVTSHSPAIVARFEPDALRHLRRNSASGISAISRLQLPTDGDDAAKFVREAVRAHPEIYFARHAIFGEGASEEIVLPRLAEALGVPMDRSFVAIVPIGGRHVQHFWRLVTQLGIPHTTLLDLDLGRSSGDTAQFNAMAKHLGELKAPKDKVAQENLEKALQLGRDSGWGEKGWSWELLEGWVSFFETQGAFFASPLDLDMLTLEAFPNAYQSMSAGARGPNTPDDEATQKSAAERVLGTGGFGMTPYVGRAEMALFPWYAYLFLGDRGKPAVHLGALSRLDNDALQDGCPPVLERLIKRVRDQLSEKVE